MHKWTSIGPVGFIPLHVRRDCKLLKKTSKEGGAPIISMRLKLARLKLKYSKENYAMEGMQ